MKPWSMGFMGALTNEACRWLTESIPEHVRTVGVPFLGSAKAVVMMAEKGLDIESWDTQYVVRAMVEGIFTAKKEDIRVPEPKMRKGYVYQERPFRHITDEAAGLVDYIAAHGSNFEHVALATSIIRSTFAGRMSDWNESATPTAVWNQFLKRIAHQKGYLNLSQSWKHHEDNFFNSQPGRYDLLYVDPPKVISNSDVYSGNFGKLNRALGVEPKEFDRWTRYDFIGKIRQVLETKSDHLVFIYTSDVRPTVDEVQRLLDEYGTKLENKWFKHRNRLDYVLVYDRR